MQLRFFFYTLLTFFCTITAYSQKNVVVTGGDAQSEEGSVSYSVGQVDYLNTEASTGSVSAGVQQSIIVRKLPRYPGDTVTITVYPNPVHDVCVVTVSDENSTFDYKVTDMSSRKMFRGSFKHSVQLDFSKLANGGYILWLNSRAGLIKNEGFKLLKY